MARSGMDNLIAQLRAFTNAGTADYTISTVTYWTDDQLQIVLDRHRNDVYREMLFSTPRYTGGGSVEYLDYYTRHTNLESGTAYFWLEDGAGSNVGTSIYSVDYANGRITFTQDTGGSTYYLTGREYDLNGAAADVWKQKIGQIAMTSFDWASDNMKVSRSQAVQQAQFMANYYQQMAWPTIVTMTRSDVNVSGERHDVD